MATQLRFKVRRGPKAHLPDLEEGEVGFATDSRELFIGTDMTTNVQINTSAEVDEKIAAHKVEAGAHDISVVTGAISSAGAQAMADAALAAAKIDAQARVYVHAVRTDNPHTVTLAQVGGAPASHVNAVLGSTATHPMPSYSDVGAAASGHNHSGTYEPILGNPTFDGQALVSTAAGARSWTTLYPTPGITNYIANGRKFSANGLDLTISSGLESISGKSATLPENTVTLTASRAQLVYDTLTGNTSTILAAFPDSDAGTLYRWILNGNGTIVSTVGSNNLTFQVSAGPAPGWANDTCSDFGASNYYQSANTSFPTGASACEVDIVFTSPSTLSGYKFLVHNGSQRCLFLSGNTLYITGSGGGNLSTGYVVEASKKYYIAYCYDGVNDLVYVNGFPVFRNAATRTVTAATLYVGAHPTSGHYYEGEIDYLEVRTSCRTAAQISAISNALLLPHRHYTNETSNTYTDIRALLPSDGIALGFAWTGASAVTESNDVDYKYGRREKAVGGNRLVFSGWKQYTVAAYFTFYNPFDTRKVRTYFVWAEDSSGMNESDLSDSYYSGSSNTGLLVNYGQSSAFRAGGYACSTLIYINTTGKATGYIGCYSEVIE